MKDIRVPFLERITPDKSKEIAEGFLKANGFWGKNLPMQIEILALKTNHPVEFIPELRTRFDCKGTAWFNKTRNRLEIYIDSDHYQSEYNSCQFTIAEELAHIMLHASIFNQVETPTDRLELDTNTKESTHIIIEKQAKQVASELLLPTDMFYPYICDWVKHNLDAIKKDRPANEADFIRFVSEKVGDKLGLNDIVIRRALLRQFDEMIIPKLIKEHGIKYLEDIPSRGIGKTLK
jgi:hypothetical protein